jgi:hypothetical protein
MPSVQKNPDIISLGDNCEVGGNLRRLGLFDSSLLKDARSVLPDLLVLIENDFENVFSDVVAGSGGLVKCVKYNISWHSGIKFDKQNIVWSERNKLAYENQKSKLDYLTDKLKAQLNSTDEVLFIHKSPQITTLCINSFVGALKKLKPNLNFKLLVVTDKVIDESSYSNVFVEKVKYLAPYHEAIKSSDFFNWIRILKKYVSLEILIEDALYFMTPEYKEADVYRDLALFYDAHGQEKTALNLMMKAKVLRPDGGVINKFIDDKV